MTKLFRGAKMGAMLNEDGTVTPARSVGPNWTVRMAWLVLIATLVGLAAYTWLL